MMSSSMVAAVRNAYAAACPVVLEALTEQLPPASEVTASKAASLLAGGGRSLGGQMSGGGSLWVQHMNLVEVALMLCMEAGRGLKDATQAVTTPGRGTSSSPRRGNDLIQLSGACAKASVFGFGLLGDWQLVLHCECRGMQIQACRQKGG